MKIASVFAVFLLLSLSSLAGADQLLVQNVKSLASAKYVIVGKVASLSYDPKKFVGTMEVSVVETLKGKLEPKSLSFPVDNNPLNGFDVVLKKGDIAVFFIREVNGTKAHLIAPGAAATFPERYFE